MGGVIEFILNASFVIVALMMTFLILLQEGKGGGLAALGGTKAASVEGVTNPIRRATGYLSGLFFLLAVMLAALAKEKVTVAEGLYDKKKPAMTSGAESDEKKKDEAADPKPDESGAEKKDEAPEKKDGPAGEKKDAGDSKEDEKPDTLEKGAAKDGEAGDGKSDGAGDKEKEKDNKEVPAEKKQDEKAEK